jgi:hypothetical protein
MDARLLSSNRRHKADRIALHLGVAPEAQNASAVLLHGGMCCANSAPELNAVAAFHTARME